jgi:hypothetical protein
LSLAIGVLHAPSLGRRDAAARQRRSVLAFGLLLAQNHEMRATFVCASAPGNSMSNESNESQAWSFDAARLARGVLLAAAVGSSVVSACGGGGSGGGNPLEVFIVALGRGADARCACVMTPADACSSAKSRLGDCLRQAVPAADAASFPTCAGALLNQYNACVSRDGECRDAVIVSPECDTELDAARETCELPPAAQSCLDNGGTAPGSNLSPNGDPTTPDGGVPVPGNGVTTPANDGAMPPDDGTPPDPTPEGGEPNIDPPGTGCSNECEFAGDGACDDGGPGAEFDLCSLGTDCDDCGARDGETPPAGGEPNIDPPGTGCSNECEFAGDGACDDGGPGAEFDLCLLGTDCDDCGQR